jgi:hypothetical protein
MPFFFLNSKIECITIHRPPEIAEKLRVGKFNRIITPISEYSNALHNGTV